MIRYTVPVGALGVYLMDKKSVKQNWALIKVHRTELARNKLTLDISSNFQQKKVKELS